MKESILITSALLLVASVMGTINTWQVAVSATIFIGGVLLYIFEKKN